MTIAIPDKIKSHLEGFRNSYTQIFFSDNKWFAILLIGVSFMDIYAGLCGALSVIISNLLAQSMGFNDWLIRKGYYGYNSLLVGLGFGLTFHPGIPFFLLIPVSALLTFLFTVAFQGFFYKYALPYLSIPFLLGIWIIMLSSGQFSELGLSVRGIYTTNELYAIGGNWLINCVEWFDHLIVNPGLRTFLFSLGAIFFQQNLLAGLLIALGILLYSRIAFSLSVIGFLLAWGFYRITGADILSLGYSYIGFNYILTSIALGGFFIIPSRWSYLWLIWLLPLVIVMTVSLQKLFTFFHLGVYALPFNVVVLTFLYVLKIREKPGKRLVETPVQHFCPEKNLYYLRINTDRFFSPDYEPVTLPVLGEWSVSQGYNGEHTHKGEWAQGLDLVITGSDGRQFRGEGIQLRDYYCYEKPVVAVADGTVADVTDGIPDNPPGDNNIQRNWGNSIVLKHNDHLFSQVSHLKAGSTKIRKGDPVKRGDILGLCGNSGRSPYPHLHFQMQSTPHIGSKTIHYPLSNYLTAANGKPILRTHSVPEAGNKITAIQNHPLFESAFHFLPGQVMKFEVTGTLLKWLKGSHEWEVKTDEYNNSYFECRRTGAMAFFYNNGNIHYFINFLGSRKSLLYYFYLGFYEILTGFYNGLTIRDTFPPNKIHKGILMYLQDLTAPFHIFLKTGYDLTYMHLEDDFYSSKAYVQTTVRENGKILSTIDIILANNCIAEFNYQSDQLVFKAICTGSY
jgi:urea transporter/murein DD-endopeptidase MepM/ murein hydrolase activator NlpD